MYVCLECNSLFEHPSVIVDKHGLDSPPYEKTYVCPYCHGDYTKTKQCDYCKEYITGMYIVTSDGETICKNCYDEKNILNERMFL